MSESPSPLESLARAYYTCVDNTPERVVELFSQDATYKRPGYPEFVGRAALEEFYGGERVIAEGKHTLTRVHPDEQSATVMVEGVFNGTLRDGATVRAPFVDIMEFRGDKIAKRRTYFDDTSV